MRGSILVIDVPLNMKIVTGTNSLRMAQCVDNFKQFVAYGGFYIYIY
jgi:hypothetical protein